MKKLASSLQLFYHGKTVTHECKFPDEFYIDFGHGHYYSINSLDATKLTELINKFSTLQIVYNNHPAVQAYFLEVDEIEADSEEDIVAFEKQLDLCFIRETVNATEVSRIEDIFMLDLDGNMGPCVNCVFSRGTYLSKECEKCKVTGTNFKPKTK
ncbi:MAG: hypothetical protein LBH62_06585 [Nitrososphaerota archaeon]|nr:hypothetical protein [Candidatus Termiticorpusculum sp.]MCL2291897.1 hypothetical protein [Candidatus Termiticorpusculum sp.]MDR0461079.1 hypothetical protein [Nitrososphaerota archaeon]